MREWNSWCFLFHVAWFFPKQFITNSQPVQLLVFFSSWGVVPKKLLLRFGCWAIHPSIKDCFESSGISGEAHSKNPRVPGYAWNGGIEYAYEIVNQQHTPSTNHWLVSKIHIWDDTLIKSLPDWELTYPHQRHVWLEDFRKKKPKPGYGKSLHKKHISI